VELPEPRIQSDFSIEEALLKRRSIRDYRDEAITLQEVSQLLWSAQGITGPWGFRTAPSAGATYPLVVYLVVGDVDGLEHGIYRHSPGDHEVVKVIEGDHRSELARTSLDQKWVEEGAIDVIIAADYEKTTQRYGERGLRYVHMEAGHAAQNLYLQAEALNLGMVVVGAFNDDQVAEILNLPDWEDPLYVIPVGRKMGAQTK
jgi:SagB-type dehydrogenase family enzyme